jgi:hypothetical protein
MSLVFSAQLDGSGPSNEGADSFPIVMLPVVGSTEAGPEEVLMAVIEQCAAPTVRHGLAWLLRDLLVISRPRFWFLCIVAVR